MAEIKSKAYLTLRQRHGKFINAIEALGQAAKQEGPLDAKSGHLIQLAAAAAIRSEGAVHSHTRRALEAGAEAGEVYHSLILLTSTVGFPTVVAAMTWAEDVIEGKK